MSVVAAGSPAASLSTSTSSGPVWRWLTSARTFWAFAALLTLYNTLGVVYLHAWAGVDFWEHLAAIDAFARNPLHPRNPYVLGPESSHLYTPYHFLWGLLVAMTRSSAYALAPLMAAVNTMAFAIGARRISSRLTGHPDFALPVALAMLFLWLKPYGWSGFHDFGLLPLTAIYPYWLALPVAMIAIGTFDERRAVTIVEWLALVIVVAFVFLVHPLTGSFLTLVLAIRAFAEPSLPAGRRLACVAAPALGVALSLAWPFFPVLTAITGAPQFAKQGFAGQWREFYDRFAIRLLPAALGLYELAYAWRRRSLDWVTWTFLACTGLYLVNPVSLRTAFLARYVIYVALALQWCTVRWLARSRAEGGRRAAAALALFLLVVMGGAVLEVRTSLAWLGAPWSGVAQSPAGDRDDREVVRRFLALAPSLTHRDVVMASMEESWVLPAVIGCRVVGVLHSNPFMHDWEARQAAVQRFFDPAASAAQRAALIRSYHVTRVLVPARTAPSLGLGALGRRVLADGYYELWDVGSSPSD